MCAPFNVPNASTGRDGVAGAEELWAHAPIASAPTSTTKEVLMRYVGSVTVIHQRNRVDAFAVTAPGLEAICAGEAVALGVRPTVGEGGVAWRGSMESVARANLWLRTASRVLVRVAEFKASAFFELELAARRLAWNRFLTPGSTVRFRVTCRKSKLYHSDAVAQRLADAVMRRVPGVKVVTSKSADDVGDEGGGDAEQEQLFVVRLFHDVCTVSADTSGALLHRRGYRQQLAKAPLRETIAAAMLLGAGWPGDVPLVDPMCGSGTIPIEAAWMARRIAPGRNRDFAFRAWPEFDASMWTRLVDEARSGELPRVAAPIAASDRDAGAIEAARANAARGGVESDVSFTVAPISALEPRRGEGWLISNPPYGVRVGERDRLRNLYAQLGNVARNSRDGRSAFFSPIGDSRARSGWSCARPSRHGTAASRFA
jgi:putative N6-adenine-specific DNA methylase